MKRLEHFLEGAIFASRWLLLPLYLGLCLSLLLLLYGFVHHITDVIDHLKNFQKENLVLTILELIDLSLAGNLILLVTFSGYENFVSRMNLGPHEDIPSWKGTVDFSALKLKLISSVIAIGSIYLLEMLLGLKHVTQQNIINGVVIYSVLVVSGLIMALMDYIATLTKRNKG